MISIEFVLLIFSAKGVKFKEYAFSRISMFNFFSFFFFFHCMQQPREHFQPILLKIWEKNREKIFSRISNKIG